MSFPNFSPFPFSFAYLHIPEASLQPGYCLWGEAWRIFNLSVCSIRLSLQSLLLHMSCVPSLRLFSWSCLSLKGHLQRTADVSCKDLEAVLPSGCFTQESDGFFLVNSFLTALNYTEEAEEKRRRGSGRVCLEQKMGKKHPFNLFCSGFLISWNAELLILCQCSSCSPMATLPCARAMLGAGEGTVTQLPLRVKHSISVPAALANRISG